jgi:hypothetical protein
MTSYTQLVVQRRAWRPKLLTETAGVRLPTGLIQEVEEWRAALRPIPSKGEAIRRLLQDALLLHKRGAASEAKKRKG